MSSVGDVTKPIISVRRHCVLLGLYPIHCVVMSDEMILIESRNLSKSKNEILEKSAIQIKLAMMSCVNIGDKEKSESLSKHQNTPFDQICFEAIFVTVGGIHRNALDAQNRKAVDIERLYNTTTYVDIMAQRAMQLQKSRLVRLLETVKAHVNSLQELIDDDIKMGKKFPIISVS